ncbi:guanine-N-1-methyltransferase [Trametes versicolor FP-101664 SS1]|uniref:guanine-N-1-methyltransferase n=1 Tax=Trametes versicolor (strain FP-101664) TaxID=717944 RepID=UPI0004622C81|nr:guanine-N-1-methyltransferase [Trametes versicolor FP-101664 SS1]EIW63983.1 guanine-N-1-methyltransferase [Trametes versicolor FP-101664 SS1]
MPQGISQHLFLPKGRGIGLKDGKLDKEPFRKVLPVLAAKVAPEKAGVLLKSSVMKRSLLDVPRVKSVARGPNDERLVLLKYSDQADLTPEVQDFLQTQSAELVSHDIVFDYDYWTADEIIHAILPEEIESGAPSGFATVGHLAHLNLRPEYLPYKYVIGQVILDKSPTCRTVINKLDNIANQFRVFRMELLAGEPDYVVTQSENGCQFTFDFREVYWNSRLHTEHERIIANFKTEDVVADVFAGVGPFAIPAAKKGCAVLANDLNPSSYKYLTQNIAENKVDSLVRPSCEDGRAFIRSAFNRAYDDSLPPVPPRKPSKAEVKERRAEGQAPPPPPGPTRQRVDHFVMNLPDTAILFLDAFRGVLSPANAGERDLSGLYAEGSMPMIHCHCFTRELEPEKAEVDIRQRVEEKIGQGLGEEATFHWVRSVAPQKEMYCVSFRLPHAAAFASP